MDECCATTARAGGTGRDRDQVTQPHEGRKTMRTLMSIAGLLAGLLSVPAPLVAQRAAVTPLMEKTLKDIPGKEVLMLEVTYPPTGADPIHRHVAHGFIYVL